MTQSGRHRGTPPATPKSKVAPVPQSVPAVAWTDQLLQVLRRQQELCDRLRVDFERAEDLTSDAQRSATLLSSLRRRQRFVDEIMRLDRSMGDLRERWRQERDRVALAIRQEIERAASGVRDALDAASEADGRLIAELKSASERVRSDLALISQGRVANRGYGNVDRHQRPANALPSNRFLDGRA